ncbi:hypothetical protein BDQ17DRAFT_788119 [Cyathus striatus]|nr:hypothetical protein BDQ17DRAFT_788119 [Cyathus striatus]
MSFSRSEPPPDDIHALPQYGFGSDVDFDQLISQNRFLFRVYTPKERSPFFDDTDPFFLAPKFDERYSSSPNSDWGSSLAPGSYTDVATHMDWTTRPASPYVSLSFSFIWSIWEAMRRYHLGMKKDVQIAIIDSIALHKKAYTAVQLLRLASPKERRREYWRWYRYAQESQLVLAYGGVSGTAVLASIPLLSIIPKMPAYFLQTDSNSITGNPLAYVAWDYTKRKPNYRQFCHDMTSRFFGLSPESRLQETTTGSVRLALTLLRPWFHGEVVKDFALASSTLCWLAVVIAQWPAQWWARNHEELWKIVRAMVLALAEELQQKYQVQQNDESLQLHHVIDELEGAVSAYEKKMSLMKTVDESRWSAPPSAVEPQESYNSFPDVAPAGRPHLEVTFSLPAIPLRPTLYETPITPPASPRVSMSFPSSTSKPAQIITSSSDRSSKTEYEFHDTASLGEIASKKPVESQSPKLPSENLCSPTARPVDYSVEHDVTEVSVESHDNLPEDEEALESLSNALTPPNGRSSPVLAASYDSNTSAFEILSEPPTPILLETSQSTPPTLEKCEVGLEFPSTLNNRKTDEECFPITSLKDEENPKSSIISLPLERAPIIIPPLPASRLSSPFVSCRRGAPSYI